MVWLPGSNAVVATPAVPPLRLTVATGVPSTVNRTEPDGAPADPDGARTLRTKFTRTPNRLVPAGASVSPRTAGRSGRLWLAANVGDCWLDVPPGTGVSGSPK